MPGADGNCLQTGKKKTIYLRISQNGEYFPVITLRPNGYRAPGVGGCHCVCWSNYSNIPAFRKIRTLLMKTGDQMLPLFSA